MLTLLCPKLQRLVENNKQQIMKIIFLFFIVRLRLIFNSRYFSDPRYRSSATCASFLSLIRHGITARLCRLVYQEPTVSDQREINPRQRGVMASNLFFRLFTEDFTNFISFLKAELTSFSQISASSIFVTSINFCNTSLYICF